MNNFTKNPTNNLIDLNGMDTRFGAEVKRRSGVNFNACWHCKTCVNGCPFSQAMDYAPNGIIRLVQLGQKQQALQSSTIWICVGCNTCSIQCPNAIDIPGINDTLREIAIEEGVAVAEPDIYNLHREVLNSIERYGRTHKLEIMMRYKLRKKDWLSDVVVGLKMLAKRKLDLLPSKIGDIEKIKRLFRPKQTV
ncbi:MAG: 4Fe-4S dicluster domain-containing protein [Desulfobacterales bacterium]|jgi:heterodisulfide reductase subunit C